MKVMLLVVSMVVAACLPTVRGLAAKPAEAAPVFRNCRNTQLLIQYQRSEGAAGHIAIVYRIHNVSGRACTLYGYPGVRLLDRHFLTQPTTVHRGGNFLGAIPKRLVRVGVHGDAYFTLVYSDVPVSNRPCATSRYLMIFAPNDVLPVVTYAFGPVGITACDGSIDVSPATARPRFQ